MRARWPRKWRPRRPGGKRPPTRWIDGSMQTNDTCVFQPTNMVCANAPNVPMSAFAGCFEIVSGENDLDWADKSESRLDRVVGRLSIGLRSIQQQLDSFSLVFARMGMLVVEEVDDITTWQPPNLWDHDHLEEFEWMWLWQGNILDDNVLLVEATGGQLGDLRTWRTIDIDCRVRRKLGKQDHLVLLGQLSNGISAETPFNVSGQYVPMLRCVFVN